MCAYKSVCMLYRTNITKINLHNKLAIDKDFLNNIRNNIKIDHTIFISFTLHHFIKEELFNSNKSFFTLTTSLLKFRNVL